MGHRIVMKRQLQRCALLASFACLAVATPAVAAKDPVKVTNGKGAQNIRSVVIGSFSIAFVSEKTDGAFAGSRNRLKGVGSIVRSKLAGVSPAHFQAITDAAYADFTARLQAAGYTIADRATLIGHEKMAKVEFLPSGTEGTITFGKDSKAKALYFAPTAFGSNAIFKGETGGASTGGMFGAVSMITSGFGPAMAKGYYVTAAKQPMISVNYVIDYADASRYGGTFAYAANVTVRESIAALETLTAVTTLNEKGGLSTLALADPIAVGGSFGELKDTTTGGQKLDNIAGAVIGGLFGGRSDNYKYVSFEADAGQYQAGATVAATRTNETMVNQLRALQ